MKTNIVNIALNQIGIKEIVGSQHNPRVLQYFSDIGHDWVTDDETAWCSAFANWVHFKAGVERSGKLNARSWLKVGTPTDNPEIGDIVVLWRVKRDDWRGHVGFFIRETQNWIYILGGNQANSVKISAYRKSRLLGYRSCK